MHKITYLTVLTCIVLNIQASEGPKILAPEPLRQIPRFLFSPHSTPNSSPESSATDSPAPSSAGTNISAFDNFFASPDRSQLRYILEYVLTMPNGQQILIKEYRKHPFSTPSGHYFFSKNPHLIPAELPTRVYARFGLPQVLATTHFQQQARLTGFESLEQQKQTPYTPVHVTHQIPPSRWPDIKQNNQSSLNTNAQKFVPSAKK